MYVRLGTSSVYLVSTVPVAGITIYYLKTVGQGQVYRNLEPPGNIKLTPTYMQAAWLQPSSVLLFV